jgi:hypothetical protein
MILVTRKSVFTGIVRTKEFPITKEQLISWESGNQLIQDAFPNLSADDREFIMTGVVKEEWNEIFDEEE